MLCSLIFALGISLSDTPQSCPVQHYETLHIPQAVLADAQKRAKLSTLLIDSLRDYSKHFTIDARREKEIRKLAKELAKEK